MQLHKQQPQCGRQTALQANERVKLPVQGGSAYKHLAGTVHSVCVCVWNSISDLLGCPRRYLVCLSGDDSHDLWPPCSGQLFIFCLSIAPSGPEGTLPLTVTVLLMEATVNWRTSYILWLQLYLSRVCWMLWYQNPLQSWQISSLFLAFGFSSSDPQLLFPSYRILSLISSRFILQVVRLSSEMLFSICGSVTICQQFVSLANSCRKKKNAISNSPFPLPWFIYIDNEVRKECHPIVWSFLLNYPTLIRTLKFA